MFTSFQFDPKNLLEFFLSFPSQGHGPRGLCSKAIHPPGVAEVLSKENLKKTQEDSLDQIEHIPWITL